MRLFRSIRWRLQLWYGLLFAVLLIGFGVTAYRFERGKRLELIDGELERLTDALNQATRPPPQGIDPRRPPARPAEVAIAEIFNDEVIARGIYYAIWRKNGVPFVASANAPVDLPPPPQRETRGVRWRGDRREAYFQPNPEDFVLVGRPAGADLAAMRHFGWKLASIGLGVLGGVLVIGAWLVNRTLRPIRDITEAAMRIATGDLTQRIGSTDTGSELGELVGVLNSTFSRLEAAFAQQGHFTADAAHELRTPVTVILTHAQNALETNGLSEEQREALEAVQRAARRMRGLIESLLQLARLDTGEDRMKLEATDVAVVARESLELIAPLVQLRRMDVAADLRPAVARGDRGRVGQVITNLLSNAVHHSGDGRRIRLATRVEGDRAVIEVADEGPGIAPEHLAHLFDRFYRVDQARTTNAGRTGLGLAISKAIVEAHGGIIEVASTLGEGATFTVRLPRAE